MLKRHTICLLSLVLVSTLAGITGAAAAAKSDVLVVPDRQRMVALAFDVQALRPIVLVTYRGNALSKAPLLHVWNSRSNAWNQISPEDFLFGRYMPAQPNNLYLVGADSDLPPSVIEGAGQARNVIRINSLNIAAAANIFNETMKFSGREWKTLSTRHGLQTRDLNVDKRKWGRFGPPGSRIEPPRAAREATVSEDVMAKEDATLETAVDASNAEIPAEETAAPPAEEAAVRTAEEAAVIPAGENAAPPEAASPFIPDASAGQPLDPDDLPATMPAADLPPEDK